MKGKSRTGSIGRKLAAAGLVLSFAVTAGNVFGGQKKGANVIVTLRDGSQGRGELIAVKPASILILDLAGKDASFELRKIAMVRVFAKSNSGGGVGVGLLVGFGFGVALGASADNDATLETGFLGAAAGLVIGLLAEVGAGGPRDFELQGVSQESLKQSLKTLNKHARYKEFK